ncbi:MAG TPA: hypothetical protein VLT45_11940 [Kofleriaceae bacterium]|nr:hypothetical protein [Kofleriaceae bacterium]
MGATEPLDSMREPRDMKDALTRKQRLVERMTELDMQLSKPDGGLGIASVWLKEVRPQVVAEKQRLMAALRPINAWIKSRHRVRKLSEAAAMKALLAIIDRVQDEGFALTDDEQNVLDEAAYIVDVIEAACAEVG